MNPLTGRFWTHDGYEGQIEDPASLHKYLYTGADPIHGVDPSGHDTMAESAITAGQVAIVAAISTLAYVEHRDRAVSRATTLIIGALWSQAVSTAASVSEFITGADEERKLREKVDEIARRRPNIRIFLHGTSTGSWSDLTSGPITLDPSKGGGQFGIGFYTFPFSLEGVYASIDWAKGRATAYGGEPAVVAVGIEERTYEGLRKLYVPGGQKPAMNAFELTGYDVVIGPLTDANPGYPDQYKFEGWGARGLFPAGVFFFR